MLQSRGASTVQSPALMDLGRPRTIAMCASVILSANGSVKLEGKVALSHLVGLGVESPKANEKAVWSL